MIYILKMEEKELKESLKSFLDQFDKKDIYTQVILEMLFEELIKKNEK